MSGEEGIFIPNMRAVISRSWLSLAPQALWAKLDKHTAGATVRSSLSTLQDIYVRLENIIRYTNAFTVPICLQLVMFFCFAGNRLRKERRSGFRINSYQPVRQICHQRAAPRCAMATTKTSDHVGSTDPLMLQIRVGHRSMGLPPRIHNVVNQTRRVRVVSGVS